MATVAQRSFAGGELSPSLYARVDLIKYITGLRTCRNFFVRKEGGVSNRAGTKLTTEVKDSTKRVRLIPFIFNAEQTYVLEFGDFYLRFIRNGSQITVSGLSTWLAGTTYAVGDLVTHLGVNYYSKVSGNIGNTPASSPTFWYALTGNIYEIPTPYAEADLQDIHFVQSGDVVFLTHQSYAVRELSRTAHTRWVLVAASFQPSISAPSGLAVSGGTGTTDQWVVTSIKAETFEESLPTAPVGASSKATSGAPRTLSWTAVAGAGEYNVYKNINGVYGFIGVAGSNSFVDDGIEADATDTPPQVRNPFAETPMATVAVGAGGSGYAVGRILNVIQAGASGGQVRVETISGTAVTSVKIINPGTGYAVASGLATTPASGGGTGCTINITAVTVNNFPATAGFFQQRLGFANTLNEPEKCYFSKSGQFRNFTTSAPLQDDDAVTFNLAGRRVNAIQHILDLGNLLALTSDIEWLVQGDTAGILKPGEVNPKAQSYNGSKNKRPILINDNAIYLQARGTIIRDLFSTIDATGDVGYKGTDLSVFANHLFEGYTIEDWDYAQNPQSIIWAVRSDGTVVALTYLREHQIWAWHRHDTDGTFENVVVVPEGAEDVPYFVVRRTINGTPRRFIERMNTRALSLIEDYIGMDSALSFDGRNSSATTMTLTGGVTWAYTETLTLTSSAAFFTAGDVGNQIWMYTADGDVVRCTITAFTSTTVVSVKPHKTVPVSLRAAATTDWDRAVDEILGLSHLEGKNVSVLANGFVVANPLNPTYPVLTVTGGMITLDKPYSVIHVGLPFVSDVQTLDVDSTGAETMADKKKIVSRVTVFVVSSRGIWAGANVPDDNVSFLDGLQEYKPRNNEPYSDPASIIPSDQIDINIQPEWNSNGRVFIRQVEPLPLSVLAVMPAGMFPARGA